MSNKNKANYHVVKNPKGGWDAKREKAERSSGNFKTQEAAEKAAKKFSENQGGGEVSTHGMDGKIRSKDTIPPGKDPNPPKDLEH